MRLQTEANRGGRAARTLAALVLGVLIGCFLHYLLYRYSLPSNPFIYVAF